MKLTNHIRNFIDKHLPLIAKSYRLIRDYFIYISYKPYQTKYGFLLYGEANFDISREKTGEIEILSKYLSPKSVFIDVGANIGLFTCFANKLQCKVIAIEPNPLNFKLLCRNLYINKIKDVDVYCAALSDSCEIKPLHGGLQGASLIKGWGNIHSTYINLVPSLTLDRITENINNENLFIKIDVEGAEFYVLKGAQKTLTNLNSLWLIENSLTENFQSINPHYKDVFEFFWSKNYLSYSIVLRKIIDEREINNWIKNGSSGTDNINFFFFHPSKNKIKI